MEDKGDDPTTGDSQLDKSYTNDRNNPRNNSPQKTGESLNFLKCGYCECVVVFFSENGIPPIDIIPISV